MAVWKQKNYASGKKLESYINATLWLFKGYEKLDYTQLIETRRKKEPCDFVAWTKDNSFFLECKETTQKKLYRKNKIKDHQIENIVQKQNWGYCAGLIVWFEQLDPYMKNVRFIEIVTREIDSYTIEDGIIFSPNIFDRKQLLIETTNPINKRNSNE